jgi:hypothetical protein
MHACGVYIYVCICACLHCRYTERSIDRPTDRPTTLEYPRVPCSTLEHAHARNACRRPTFKTCRLGSARRAAERKTGENDSCCKRGLEQVVNCGVRKLVELNPEYAVQVNDDADVEVRLHYCRYWQYFAVLCQYCQCLLVRPARSAHAECASAAPRVAIGTQAI